MNIKIQDENLQSKIDTLKKSNWEGFEYYQEREFILNEVNGPRDLVGYNLLFI